MTMSRKQVWKTSHMSGKNSCIAHALYSKDCKKWVHYCTVQVHLFLYTRLSRLRMFTTGSFTTLHSTVAIF
jgi:hypothetical protein